MKSKVTSKGKFLENKGQSYMVWHSIFNRFLSKKTPMVFNPFFSDETPSHGFVPTFKMCRLRTRKSKEIREGKNSEGGFYYSVI